MCGGQNLWLCIIYRALENTATWINMQQSQQAQFQSLFWVNLNVLVLTISAKKKKKTCLTTCTHWVCTAELQSCSQTASLLGHWGQIVCRLGNLSRSRAGTWMNEQQCGTEDVSRSTRTETKMILCRQQHRMYIAVYVTLWSSWKEGGGGHEERGMDLCVIALLALSLPIIQPSRFLSSYLF